MMFTRGFSLTNFVIGSSALSFQIFVLYPWHMKLEDKFEEMRTEHLKMMQQSEKARLAELQDIKNQMARHSGKKWF
jgi:hypothetical protein